MCGAGSNARRRRSTKAGGTALHYSIHATAPLLGRRETISGRDTAVHEQDYRSRTSCPEASSAAGRPPRSPEPTARPERFNDRRPDGSAEPLRVDLPEEATALRVPAGVPVIVIERTYLAGETPIETADIVAPADRYELQYGIPLP